MFNQREKSASEVPDLPLSIIAPASIPLPLNLITPHHIHVAIIIPFSLLIQNFNPNTIQTLNLTNSTPRSTPWATRLFGHRQEPLTEPSDKATRIAFPHLNHHLWPRVSAALFGREDQQALYAGLVCDVRDWERVNDSRLVWTALVGSIENPGARVVVLKAVDDGLGLGRGGMSFTLEEMGEKEMEAWREAYADLALPGFSGPPLPAVGDSMNEVIRRNFALRRWIEDTR